MGGMRVRPTRQQAGAMPEAVLLRAIPRTDDTPHTAFTPVEEHRAGKERRSTRTLLDTPGITLPGMAHWRRPGRRHNR